MGNSQQQRRTSNQPHRWHWFTEIPAEPRAALILVWITAACSTYDTVRVLSYGFLRPQSYLIYLFAAILTLALLIQLHYRRNWARIVYLVLGGLSLAFWLLALITGLLSPVMRALVSLGTWVIEFGTVALLLAEFVLLVRPAARRWFNPPPARGGRVRLSSPPSGRSDGAVI